MPALRGTAGTGRWALNAGTPWRIPGTRTPGKQSSPSGRRRRRRLLVQAPGELDTLSGMKPLLSRSAIARIAENRIREAIEAGELEDLPGLGKPIPGIDEPYDPLWWVKSWMKRIEEEHGRLAPPR